MTSLVLERERLQDFTKNGPKVQPTFSAAEMQRRLDAIRGMAEAGIDAALFTSHHCINYYSDFLFCYFGRRYGLVVTPTPRPRSRPASTAASRRGAPSAATSPTPTGRRTTTSTPSAN